MSKLIICTPGTLVEAGLGQRRPSVVAFAAPSLLLHLNVARRRVSCHLSFVVWLIFLPPACTMSKLFLALCLVAASASDFAESPHATVDLRISDAG